jgi:ABC-type dipeptide/oligopeptide/nickel transport system ATPase component
MSILFISHDLLSVATISHRVAVMEKGQIIECRNTADLFTDPEDFYTRKLIAALPVVPQFSLEKTKHPTAAMPRSLFSASTVSTPDSIQS